MKSCEVPLLPLPEWRAVLPLLINVPLRAHRDLAETGEVRRHGVKGEGSPEAHPADPMP
jgi:hypothetical protein